MITRHFRNSLYYIQTRKSTVEATDVGSGARERWEEVDVVGALLKMGIGR
jgi:vacuolar protein sorting-associated protein 35